MDQRLYNGYVNYFILPDRRQVKTHHFENKTDAEVTEIKKRFRNPKYIYCGCLTTKAK